MPFIFDLSSFPDELRGAFVFLEERGAGFGAVSDGVCQFLNSLCSDMLMKSEDESCLPAAQAWRDASRNLCEYLETYYHVFRRHFEIGPEQWPEGKRVGISHELPRSAHEIRVRREAPAFADVCRSYRDCDCTKEERREILNRYEKKLRSGDGIIGNPFPRIRLLEVLHHPAESFCEDYIMESVDEESSQWKSFVGKMSESFNHALLAIYNAVTRTEKPKMRDALRETLEENGRFANFVRQNLVAPGFVTETELKPESKKGDSTRWIGELVVHLREADLPGRSYRDCLDYVLRGAQRGDAHYDECIRARKLKAIWGTKFSTLAVMARSIGSGVHPGRAIEAQEKKDERRKRVEESLRPLSEENRRSSCARDGQKKAGKSSVRTGRNRCARDGGKFRPK